MDSLQTQYASPAGIFIRIEVEYEKNMWFCHVLDRGRHVYYVVFGKRMACCTDYFCSADLRL